MDVSALYAVAAGGIFASLIFIRFLANFIRLTSRIFMLILKHLIYLYLLDYYYLYSSWMCFEFLTYSLYITVNIFYLCFLS
jgi:hypothetical protein